MPCEPWRVSPPSDVIRGSKVRTNLGTSVVDGLVTRGSVSQPSVKPQKGSGPQVGVAGASGAAARQWRNRLAPPGGAEGQQRRKRRRAFVIDDCWSVRRAEASARPAPGHGRGAGNDWNRMERGDPVCSAAQQRWTVGVYPLSAERLCGATSISWGRSTEGKRGAQGCTPNFHGRKPCAVMRGTVKSSE